jgi:hypothetical protein
MMRMVLWFVVVVVAAVEEEGLLSIFGFSFSHLPL